jgi:hypothetical protein
MSFPDKFSGQDHPQYRYTKPTKDGLWGIYYPRTDNDFDRENWEREKAERQRERDRIRQSRSQSALSVEARNKDIQTILGQLTLNDAHRQRLNRRGLTDEQINEIGYVSVKKWQPLTGVISYGVNQRGNLNNPCDGILCPIRNRKGQLIALRLHNPGHKKNGLPKYLSFKGSNLKSGEFPIAVYGQNSASGIVGISEGLEFKPAIASYRLGIPVIGHNGTTFASSPIQTQETLEALGDSIIRLYPDGGVVGNPKLVAQYQAAIALYQSWGYKVEIAWWGQFNKSDGDIDEISQEKIDSIQYLTPDEFLELCPNGPVNGFKDWLENQLKPKNKGLPKVDGIEYQDGLIQELLNQGKSLLDARTTGSGKSYQVPTLINPLGGKIWYITGDHRNPTVKEIDNNFPDLHPRNEYGYYRDNDGKLKLAKADTPKDKILLTSKGKCINAGLFNQYSKLGYDLNKGGSDNPICSSCPMLQTCRFVDGWFLNDRRETLTKDHIRGHLESIPRDNDCSKDLFIYDDFKFNPTKTLETDWGKLLLEQDRLRNYLSDSHYQELDKLLQTLKPSFGDKTRYGLEHETILESLKEVILSDDLLDAIAALTLDLKEAFQTPDGIDEKNKTVANYFRHKAYQESQENLKNTPPNALIHLLKAVKGESGITLRIIKGELILTIDRRAEYSFLNEAGLILVMDATATPGDLKMMGIDRPLEVVKGSDKVTEHDNLTVVAIHTKGLGQNPYKDSHGNLKGISDRAIKRLIPLNKALKDQYGDFSVIGPKPLRELFEYEGHWHKDNRGSNDFEGLPTLGFVGLPRPNLGAVKDEYLALMGTDDGFEEHYQALINKEILQGIGRPRANRHPDKQFTVLMIIPDQDHNKSPIDLSWLKDYGVKLINKSAFEITPLAGTETQATAYRIVQAARELLTQGTKITQKAIANLAKTTQQYVSKFLEAKGLTVEMIEQKLKNILPKENTTGPIKDSLRASCITQELYKDFSEFFDLPIEDLVEDAIATIKTYGVDYFWEYLSNFPKALQGKYLIALRYLLQDEREFFSKVPIT